ncbi:MAG: helix-turn-helix domain-containing protein [Oscillospiraceae bacterium]|nr:helix-turn-helix domain-containing protein [Oscillospiraceae bacterium]
MTFGQRIATLRKEKGLTQQELAEKVGYTSRSAIAKIEADERSVSQSELVSLARVLDTTPSALVGWESDREELDYTRLAPAMHTVADRLTQLMRERSLRQIDILELCAPFCEQYGVNLDKSGLSQYISGKVVPKRDKLSILAMALGVSEVWLKGYDVPPECQGLSNDDVQDIAMAIAQMDYKKRAQLIAIMEILNK